MDETFRRRKRAYEMNEEAHSLRRHIGNYNGDYWRCLDCNCSLIINRIKSLSDNKEECDCKNE